MGYLSSYVCSGAGTFLILLMVSNTARCHSINITDSTISDFTTTDSRTATTVSEELADVASLEISGDTTHFDSPITVRVSASTSTVSSKRELRNTQSGSLGKTIVSDDPESEKVFEQIMSGTESKNDLSPSRLPAIQKMMGSRTKQPVKNRTSEMESLEDLLDIYSASRLASMWNRTLDLQISAQCRSDMTSFLQGLRRGELWALQMSDASGRYGGSFLWGNTYWLGSATLCRQISHMASKPPFPLGFYVLRTYIVLDVRITPQMRSQLMGVCLPRSCEAEDVNRVVQLSAREARLGSQRSVDVLAVKSPQTEYIMSEDPIFVLIVISCVIVGLFLTAGTALDIYRQRKLATRSNFTYDNYTFVFSKSAHCSINTTPVPVKMGLSRENNNSRLPESESPPDGSDPTTENNSVTSDETVVKTGLLTEILLSFSIRKNLNTICDQSVGADTIPTVHGLRSISMAWVILGHTCIVAFKYSDNNVLQRSC